MRTKPYCEKLTITPKMAEQFLERNINNRPCDPRLVDQYAEDMLNGTFGATNSIVIGEDGTLYDGQTRLKAIIKSGVSLRLTVEYNTPVSERPTIDIGRKRMSKHWLTMIGVQNATSISAALSYVTKWERGQLGWDMCAVIKPFEAENVFNRHPGITEYGRCRVSFAPGSLISGMAYIFSKKDKKLADVFFAGMMNGFDPKENPAFHKIREFFIASKTSNHQKMKRNYACAYLVLAWNAERTKKKTVSFRWVAGVNEFPEII